MVLGGYEEFQRVAGAFQGCFNEFKGGLSGFQLVQGVMKNVAGVISGFQGRLIAI